MELFIFFLIAVLFIVGACLMFPTRAKTKYIPPYDPIPIGTWRIVPDHLWFTVQRYEGMDKWVSGTSYLNGCYDYFCVGKSEIECEKYIAVQLQKEQEFKERKIKITIHKANNPPRIVPPYKFIEDSSSPERSIQGNGPS